MKKNSRKKKRLETVLFLFIRFTVDPLYDNVTSVVRSFIGIHTASKSVNPENISPSPKPLSTRSTIKPFDSADPINPCVKRTKAIENIENEKNK